MIRRQVSPPRKRSADRQQANDRPAEDEPEGEAVRNRGGGDLFGFANSGADEDEPEGEAVRNRGGGALAGFANSGEDEDEPEGEGVRNRGGGGLFGMGYIPDTSDLRDHSIKDMLRHTASEYHWMPKFLRSRKLNASHLPPQIDLRLTGGNGDPFGPVRSQGRTQSCTAHAVAAMSEFHFKRKHDHCTTLSRLFLYKISRELLGLETDSGCSLRATCKAMNKYGCVHEHDWPRGRSGLEKLPRLRDLDRASQCHFLGYSRIDQPNFDGLQTLSALLHCLADGHPVAFGFSLHSCHARVVKSGVIPFPTSSSSVVGGHAVLAIGYELAKSFSFHKPKGHLLIRNSWGADWGENGYGWLPFEYIAQQLAYDFWFQYDLSSSVGSTPVLSPAESSRNKIKRFMKSI